MSAGDISFTVPCLFGEQGEGEAWLPRELCSSTGTQYVVVRSCGTARHRPCWAARGQFKHLIKMHIPSPRIHTFHCLRSSWKCYIRPPSQQLGSRDSSTSDTSELCQLSQHQELLGLGSSQAREHCQQRGEHSQPQPWENRTQ